MAGGERWCTLTVFISLEFGGAKGEEEGVTEAEVVGVRDEVATIPG
jgi:hypothetical protein